ncbi:Hsp70 family protein [Pseudomonas oryzae]|uniref:Molecular chaperone DnaK (HSP70) n=1 Tax=Pseudomonas oryzae TaxID=1392877 RepID=A0A1H1MY51_9PSED|nr:Hsp70 family protein [Pseudomonas oryzae]SDR91600.1 Molecular chaperone DnaK (HSP70) [Pseudomonas oryzae]
MAIYGFDFGTTNSLISVIEGDRCISFTDSGLPHPSVVCYDGDEVIVGRRARERLASAGLGVIGNVVRSPKTLLGKHSVHVDGVSRSPRQMVADIVRFVTSHAEDERQADYSRAVVTIPVDMNGERRRDLREAFRLAGVTIDQFVHEPLAALYGHLRTLPDFASEIRRLDRQYMLVFDWGGGTLDLTLCQLVDGYLVQIANHGCSHLGGDVIDESIMHEVERRHCARHAQLESVGVAADAQKRLLARAERAKIELSIKSQAQIYVPNYFRTEEGDPDLDYVLPREELEEIVNAKLTEGLQMIAALLATVDFEPADISLCLATGGMVNMPLIKTRLLEMFGPQRLCVSDRGQLIISEGAAWIAHDRANLLLAKNIELALARDTRHVAIKAGSEMPREGSIQQAERLNLYCTDPRDGVAKIQLEVPARRHGRYVQASDARNNLASLSVRVDGKSARLFERVELDMRVDENLILKVDARSTVANDHDATEIHNLEFGLSLGGSSGKGQYLGDASVKKPKDRSSSDHQGAVLLRSNLALREDKSLVPGEYLHEVQKQTPYTRVPLTPLQDREKLYYAPCSGCGRRSNDPLCKCGSGGTGNFRRVVFDF